MCAAARENGWATKRLCRGGEGEGPPRPAARPVGVSVAEMPATLVPIAVLAGRRPGRLEVLLEDLITGVAIIGMEHWYVKGQPPVYLGHE